MAGEVKQLSGSTKALIAAAAVAALTLAIVVGFVFWPRSGGTQVGGPRVPAAAGGGEDAAVGDPSSEELTTEIAQTVWAQFSQAKDSEDVAAFTEATCGQFIADAMRRRHATSAADLLAAFTESEKWVQPLSVEDVEVVGANTTGARTGRMNAEATITDNTRFPNQTPQRQPWHVDMAYEQGRWKMCPSAPLSQRQTP